MRPFKRCSSVSGPSAQKEEGRIIHRVVYDLFSVSFVSLMTVLVGTILDSLVISNFLSETAFAAFGLTAPLANLIELAGNLIAAGCVVVCGSLIGAGKGSEANRTFDSCFTLCLTAGTCAALLLAAFPEALSFLASQKGPQFLPSMLRYVRGMAPGIPAMLLAALLNGIVQLDGDKKRVVAGACVISAANIAGDIAAVLLTDAGLFGIGVATAFSYLCGTVVLLGHFRKGGSVFRPGISFSSPAQALSGGLPSVFNRGATMLRNCFFNMFALSWGGADGIVAWSTVNSISAFLSAFLSALPKAFGQATLLGSGVFIGEEDRDSLIRFMMYTLSLRTAVTAAAAAAVMAFAPALVALYIPSSSAAFADAVSGLRWYAAGLFPYTLNAIAANYMQSAKKKAASQAVNLMDGFAMPALCALLLLRLIGFRGLCISFFLGKGIVLAVTLLCLLSGRRSSQFPVERLLMLPNKHGASDGLRFAATLTRKEDAADISQRAISYCLERGIDRRVSYHVGLALEEMSVIIIDRAFGDGKKHSIEIRLFVKEGHLTVRLRDDCRAFTAAQRVAIMDPQDRAANIGIRILHSIAKSVEYYSALGMNYMLVRV